MLCPGNQTVSPAEISSTPGGTEDSFFKRKSKKTKEKENQAMESPPLVNEITGPHIIFGGKFLNLHYFWFNTFA